MTQSRGYLKLSNGRKIYFSHFSEKALDFFLAKLNYMTKEVKHCCYVSSLTFHIVFDNYAKSLIFLQYLPAAKFKAFKFPSFCLDLPKFTHSTADFYQNSAHLVNKNTDYRASWFCLIAKPKNSTLQKNAYSFKREKTANEINNRDAISCGSRTH